MRDSIKPIVAIVTCVGALAFGGSEAMAADGGCVLQGATGSISPPMQLAGGSGNMDMAGAATCVIDGAPVLSTWNYSGTYSSTVCLTFSTTGTLNLPGWGPVTVTITTFLGTATATVNGHPGGYANWWANGQAGVGCPTSLGFGGVVKP